MSSRASRVLALYRSALRQARSWPDASEADYIRAEAHTLFRRNMRLTDDRVIDECIFEVESRLELAAHYQNPFPRLYNSAPDRVYKTNPATNPRSRGEVPAYMRSYYAAAPEKKDDD